MISDDTPRTPRTFRSPTAAIALVGAVMGAGIGIGTVAGAIGAGINEPGTVETPAERIVDPYVSETGIAFPIDPFPTCVLVNGFGGVSGVHGSGGHQGLDIGTDYRQEVYAVADGELQEQIDNTGPAGYGWKLLSFPDAEGVRNQYRYYHLDAFAEDLSEGDFVSRGDLIGYVGDTGNATPDGWHLHFEIRPEWEDRQFGSVDPVDPLPLLEIPPNCINYLD